MAIVVDEYGDDGGDRHARGPARGDRRRHRGRVRPAGRVDRADRRGHRVASTGRSRSTTSTSGSTRRCPTRTTTRIAGFVFGLLGRPAGGGRRRSSHDGMRFDVLEVEGSRIHQLAVTFEQRPAEQRRPTTIASVTRSRPSSSTPRTRPAAERDQVGGRKRLTRAFAGLPLRDRGSGVWTTQQGEECFATRLSSRRADSVRRARVRRLGLRGRADPHRHRRPGFTITLKKGKTKVTSLKAGKYKIVMQGSLEHPQLPPHRARGEQEDGRRSARERSRGRSRSRRAPTSTSVTRTPRS